MTANESNSYLTYLNKIVDQYNNTYHHAMKTKPINSDYFASTKNFDSNPKTPKFRANDRARITNSKNIFSKGYTENWCREIFIINSVLKATRWAYKSKHLNVKKKKKAVGRFCEKELLKRILCMSYYSEPDSYIRDKVNV